jgi:hypothetical protein
MATVRSGEFWRREGPRWAQRYRKLRHAASLVDDGASGLP